VTSPRIVGALTLLLLLGVAASPAAEGPPQEAPRCIRTALESPPPWMWSGAWTQDGLRLLLVDVVTGEIDVYDTSGHLERTIRHLGTGPLDFNRPNRIVSSKEGYWIQDGVAHFVFLDKKLIPTDGVDTANVAPGVTGVPRAFFDWTAASGHIYGLGDILTSDEGRTWKRGWLEMDLSDPARYRIFRPAPSDDGLHRLYRMGYHYAAAEGDRVFFLLMEQDGPWILQVSPKIRRMNSFPPGLSSLPRPPSFESGQNAALVYAFVEQATYPAALYAWGGKLFVLSRAPGVQGSTRWILHVIDPDHDTLEGHLTLPSQAHHLVVIPGPKYWALVEKGPVQESGREPIDRVSFLNANLFRDPSAWEDGICSPSPGTSHE